MNILITAATENELLIAKQASVNSPHHVTCAVTGIGATATAYHTAKQLQGAAYDLVINTGIAGSFSEHLPVGSVALIAKEYFGDFGIQTQAGFSGLFDEQLLHADTFPYTNGALVCPFIKSNPLLQTMAEPLPQATGITVQTVSGQASRIAELQERFSPDMETMEGAAFFYVCLYEKIPFMALRAVSNKVAPRDKNQWNIALALTNLKAVLKQMLMK